MAYKLTYFDTQGKGEPIRFLLSYGGIDFEDNRVAIDSWPALKPDLPLPFGQIPIIEYEGKTAHQSIAICRYLAKQVKLVGKDDWENLEIDAAVDSIVDMYDKLMHHVKAAPETPFKEHFLKEDVQYYLGKLDKQIEKNNGYVAAGRLTWADLVFVPYMLILIAKSYSGAIADYPNIQENVRKIVELPRIKEWLEQHPVTE